MKILGILFAVVCLGLVYNKFRELDNLLHSHQEKIDELVADSHPIKFRLKRYFLSDAHTMERSNDYCEAVYYALEADSLISLEGEDLRFLKTMQKECDKIEKLN